jgi:hypothetical protein
MVEEYLWRSRRTYGRETDIFSREQEVEGVIGRDEKVVKAEEAQYVSMGGLTIFCDIGDNMYAKQKGERRGLSSYSGCN